MNVLDAAYNAISTSPSDSDAVVASKKKCPGKSESEYREAVEKARALKELAWSLRVDYECGIYSKLEAKKTLKEVCAGFGARTYAKSWLDAESYKFAGSLNDAAHLVEGGVGGPRARGETALKTIEIVLPGFSSKKYESALRRARDLKWKACEIRLKYERDRRFKTEAAAIKALKKSCPGFGERTYDRAWDNAKTENNF